MKNKMLNTFAVLAGITIGLAGCSGEISIGNGPSPTTTASTSPSAVAQAKELSFMESENPTIPFGSFDADGEPVQENHWKRLSENSIEVTLFGSSSCPPTVEKVIQEGVTIQLKLKEPNSEEACTADLQGHYVTVVEDSPAEKVEILSDDNENPTLLPKR